MIWDGEIQVSLELLHQSYNIWGCGAVPVRRLNMIQALVQSHGGLMARKERLHMWKINKWKDERLPRAHTSSNMSFSFSHKNQHFHVETYICEFLITSSQKSVERQSQQGQSQQQRHTHTYERHFVFFIRNISGFSA